MIDKPELRHPSSTPAEGDNWGLRLRGVIVGRRRRMVGEGHRQTELVTYRVNTNNGQIDVSTYAPQTYMAMGELIDVPIRISTYISRGAAFYTLRLADGDLPGESF